MRILYHVPVSASCHKVRIALGEKKLAHELKLEKVWERRPDFLAMNPAGEVPVLVEDDGTTLCGSQVICEYLDETCPETPLIGTSPAQRAETRRLVEWFDHKFFHEVTENLVGEKLMKRILRLGEPDGAAIRAGLSNIHYHLGYIAFLTGRRTWLAGDFCSLADITAAAHLSTIDYLGDVPWDKHPEAKDWYARMKCRPSFRPLLAERIPGSPPPKHYDDLDF